MMIVALSALLAFTTGFAIKQGNICAVAALHQWVEHADGAHFRTLLTGICCSGLVLLCTTWLLPGISTMSPTFSVTYLTLLGGVLFGIGAWFNGACVLGTIAYLSRGNLSYLGTIIGMASGAIAGQFAARPMPLGEVPWPAASKWAAAGLACLFVLIIANDRRLQHLRSQKPKLSGEQRSDLLPMIAVVGMCCGALHALNGEWSYLSAVNRLAHNLVAPETGVPLATVVLYGVATFAGGVSSAWRRRELKRLKTSMRSSLRCASGGFIMGFAGCLIPGGNESMMFYGIPSIAPQAIVAYAVMTATLLLITQTKRTIARKTLT